MTINEVIFLDNLNLTFQPVIPDGNGDYAPDQADGWLVVSGGSATVQTSGGTSLFLKMSKIGPNFMYMKDIKLTQGTSPSLLQRYSPGFGTPPSQPLTWVHTGTLPSCMTFDTSKGIYSPNGGVVEEGTDMPGTVSATNDQGTDSADFIFDIRPAS